MKTKQAFVAITLDDGRVAIMGFVTIGRGPGLPPGATWADESDGWWKREATDENIAREVVRTFAGSAAQPVRYRHIEPKDMPTDRTFRDALTDDGERLAHHMPRAREIHLRRLRDARQPVLDQLDRDWMRATGQGKTAEAAAIEAKRQELRDIPTTIGVERAATTEELKKIWPEAVPVPKQLRRFITK